jgi:uncharacterized membrane protein YadS
MTELSEPPSKTVRKLPFILSFLACFSGFISPSVALTLGILFGLILTNPFPSESGYASRWLLQASVVALGFGMNLHEVLKAGRSGFLYTALGISLRSLLDSPSGNYFPYVAILRI